MRYLGRFLAGGLLLATSVVTVGSARNVASAPPRSVSGWIPYWVTDWDRPFTATPALLADVSPMAFQMNEVPGSPDALAVFVEQTERQSDLDSIVAQARAAGATVIPSIFDQTNNNVMAQVLADPARRAAVVQAIVGLVNGRGFDGIDLDWEKFAFGDSGDSKFLVATWWPVFLTELKAALGTKILSVTVPPIWAGGSRGYPMYNWPATIGAGIVDRFRIMIYDYSTGGGPPGPIGPISWFNDVASYVTSITPVAYRNRVQLGVPTYGRSWATVTSGVCPDGTPLGSQSVQMENAATLAASKKATVIPDAASGETTFGWTETFTGPRNAPTPFPSLGGKVVTVGPVPIGGLQPAVRFRHTTCTVRRTVWVPNEWSVAQKAQLARTAGFGGIIMWAFGYETLATWTMLKGS